jgi:hypothetical protein
MPRKVSKTSRPDANPVEIIERHLGMAEAEATVVDAIAETDKCSQRYARPAGPRPKFRLNPIPQNPFIVAIVSKNLETVEH